MSAFCHSIEDHFGAPGSKDSEILSLVARLSGRLAALTWVGRTSFRIFAGEIIDA